MSKNILIIGASGYIGSRLYKTLINNNSYKVFGSYFKKSHQNLYYLDINDESSVENLVMKTKPSVIIWCAGLKDLKFTEKNKSKTFKINFEAVKILYSKAKNFKIHFIFLSTDYVFDGDKGNFSISDKTNPRTIYGKSKLLAENFIKENFSHFSIVRTSAVIGKGSLFFDWLVNKLLNNNEIDLFQSVFSPTPLNLLCTQIIHLIEKKESGIYHICGEKSFNRFEFGQHIANMLNIKDKSFITLKTETLKSGFQNNLSMKPNLPGIRKTKFNEEILIELKSYERD